MRVNELQHITLFYNVIISAGTREAAFLHAIRSAGVTFSITRACSQGHVTGCRCARRRVAEAGDVTINENNEDTTDAQRLHLAPVSHGSVTMDTDTTGSWQWGGCGADIAYGSRFSKVFLDARETDNSSTMTLMNLHNNKAGRRVSHSLLHSHLE